MPRRRATSLSSSHRAASRRLIAVPLNGPPAVCKGRLASARAPVLEAVRGVRHDQDHPGRARRPEHADAALRYALWLAERVRATVLGLHVIDVVSIEGS